MNKNLKVSIISMKDTGGGAFVAAYRLFLAIQKYGQSSDMLVQVKNTKNINVVCPIGKKDKFYYLLRVSLTRCIFFFFGDKNNPDQTLALFNSGWSKKINQNQTDIVNLHWVGGEMISIADIANISKPIIWTFHDMWAFSGINHVTYEDQNFLDSNQVTKNSFINLNLNAINRKNKSWTLPMHIVTPSNWLASYVKKNDLMSDWPVTVIPNIIDTSLFKPLNKDACKNIFGLKEDKKIILFGAFAGILNKNKGVSILFKALDHLSEKISSNSELIIFGQDEPKDFKYGKFNKVKWIGHIADEKKMCELYNCADVVVVPSRIEAFGLVAAEAHACGVPVVAFKHSGIQEVVSHKKTGYLATPFEFLDLAFGIIWTLNNSQVLSPNARQKACKYWAPEVIATKYIKLYKSVFEDFNKKHTPLN